MNFDWFSFYFYVLIYYMAISKWSRGLLKNITVVEAFYGGYPAFTIRWREAQILSIFWGGYPYFAKY